MNFFSLPYVTDPNHLIPFILNDLIFKETQTHILDSIKSVNLHMISFAITHSCM